MTSRIPHLLEPYVSIPPEGSLTLLTGILGASTNWLLLRHLYATLKGEGSEDAGVVLVSFMRDGAFWREGASKLGLDLDGLGRADRVIIVDGLTGLFTGLGDNDAATPRKDKVLTSSKLADVKRALEGAVAELKAGGSKVLVVDAPDALLAASGEDHVTSLAVQDMLLSLRSLVHNTILTLSADNALTATQTTTLERNHASLALSLAHEADMVQALRLLDTGTARDVSGVVRLTGPLVEEQEEGGGGGARREFLHQVAADGGVRVFERGT